MVAKLTKREADPFFVDPFFHESFLAIYRESEKVDKIAHLEKQLEEAKAQGEIYLKACQAFREERNEFAEKLSHLQDELDRRPAPAQRLGSRINPKESNVPQGYET